MLQGRLVARRRQTLIGAAVALSWIAVACGSSTPTPPVAVTVSPTVAPLPASQTPSPSALPTAAQTPTSTGEQHAADLIAAANLSDTTSLDAIEGQLLYTAAGGAAARAALDDGVSGGQLWAALWVYSTTGSDPGPVARYMSDPDPSIRALAATDDVEMGDPSGFDQLSQLLGDQDAMAESEPPESISNFVANALASDVVAPSAPPDGGDAQQWSDWLSTNRSKLVFDPKSGTWTGP